jgi:PPOX class probable F420-dependent enzyme
MLNLNTRFGRHVNRRLREEQIIWLTTVDGRNTPQPRPVWFHWDGQTVLIFSESLKAKLRHIARNPSVALNFNTDEEGGDVVVLAGEARVLDEQPPPNRIKAYLRKYAEGIKSLNMTADQFKDVYSVPVIVSPESMRGFVE